MSIRPLRSPVHWSATTSVGLKSLYCIATWLRHIVREASPIPIAGGETDYTCVGMQRILNANCTDVLMPDLQRIGGLTEMRNATKLAESYHTPISTHIFTEYSLSISPVVKTASASSMWTGMKVCLQARSNQTRSGSGPHGRGDRFVFDDARIANRILIAQLIDSSRVRHVPMHLGHRP